jgi:hypothetical protein
VVAGIDRFLLLEPQLVEDLVEHLPEPLDLPRPMHESDRWWAGSTQSGWKNSTAASKSRLLWAAMKALVF